MPPRRSPSRHRGLLALAAGSAALAAVWLVVLPRVGELPSVRGRIEANESRGINPGAMYYTELEAMPRLAERVDRRREASGTAFWRPSNREGGTTP
ncbi:MAG TPA: hypothetical protein VF170_08615 [Planctomycetaceae bacterium]